ncbi:unnamed protein product [Hyaloperonospora brassicae]|uniref:MRH domain-containing protein n=1 Tax=Hyaloperonospora brassicae TaxID=162125 RepID=A0AAV0TQF5_HYABA|nr:unnamed protein product [Hyaloperonospora brassicae]
MTRRVLIVALVALVSCAVTAHSSVAFDLIADHEHKSMEELKSDDTVVRCRMCGAPVAYKSNYIDLHDTSKAVASRPEAVLGDGVQLYTFVDPSRAQYELAGFKDVLGTEGDLLSKKATVFDDYSWRELRCSSCKRHIGWAFYHDELQECANTQLVDYVTLGVPEVNTAAEREQKMETVRKELEGHCLLTTTGWWTYEVCYAHEVHQFHEEPDGSRSSDWSMGAFVPETGATDTEYTGTDVTQFFAGGQHCDENGELRSTRVVYTCCKSRPEHTMVEAVEEPALCMYLIRVCVPSLCDSKWDKEEGAIGGEKQTVESCKAAVEAKHAEAELPSSFTALRWSSVISEDSGELDWARRMQIVD